MTALAHNHVAVWLDPLAPERGAFAHALEWAARLRSPLRAFAAAAEQVQTCQAACAKKGVPWSQGPVVTGIEPFLRCAALAVIGDALPAGLKQALWSRSLRGGRPAILACPQLWHPVARVLVENRQRHPGSGYLDSAAQLCRAFGAAAVVLTVARTEREAQLRQHLAEDTFARHQLAADYDSVVGCDLPAAVAGVSRWRRCSHVFMESGEPGPWWRRLWRGPLASLLGLAASVAVLALPGTPLPIPATADPGPPVSQQTTVPIYQ
jgi:hypothetical protein